MRSINGDIDVTILEYTLRSNKNNPQIPWISQGKLLI